ncbi:MAG TPA: isoamylase early set domain-containing protein [Thermodesulfobacteriota bacterium]|nr:isoamylase early set domain-containing protein [Thermodesulfobacteriota bacterium]
MKKREEGKTINTENSARKETIKKNEKKVEFSLSAPEAKEVFLTGEFNHWDIRSMPMKRGRDGNWKVQTSLSPGRYEYKFVADNHWVEGLPAAELVANSFGTQNLVLRVE